MTVIICAGKNGAVMFNDRRCSKDRAVISDIAETFPDKAICVRAYSASLFAGTKVKIIASFDELLDTDILFLEDVPFSEISGRTDTLVVYRWDREYPADLKLTVDNGFTLVSAEAFSGYSHERITKEVYQR